MALSKILVPLDEVAQNAVALNLAAEIATYFHAHIEVLGAKSSFGQGSAATPRSGDVGQDALSVFETWRHQRGLELQPECTYRGLASASLIVHDTLERGLLNRARFADLICLAAEPGEVDRQETAGLYSLLCSSGRPILLRPIREDTKDVSIMGEPIVIGWNGSKEAVRALTGALPFIRSSRRVEVLSIGEKSVNAFDAYELVKYLAWSGVRAVATGIAMEDWQGGDVIDAVLDRGAKFFVMGARKGGNATSHMLRTLPMMVLMAA